MTLVLPRVGISLASTGPPSRLLPQLGEEVVHGAVLREDGLQDPQLLEELLRVLTGVQLIGGALERQKTPKITQFWQGHNPRWGGFSL